MSNTKPPENGKLSEDEKRARQTELRAQLERRPKAPAPEKRLQGPAVPGAASRALTPNCEPDAAGPNWDYWANMPEVELWEAVALSFPIEPEALKWDRHGWMAAGSNEPHIDYDESFSDPAQARAYRSRYKLLAASCWQREHFSPAKIHMGAAHRNCVKLPEFARWASTQPLYQPLPGPLQALIQRANAQPVSSGRANWSKWRLMPRAALWKVVCLSFDIEPREDIHANSLRTRRRFVSGVPNLQDRLEILQANLSTDGPIHPQGALYGGMLQDTNCEVLLSEVAAFLLANDIEIPPDMQALASAETVHAQEPETKEQREDRRLKMCEDAGLKMDKAALLRLPDGVGKAADREGVSRQAFSDDVKAALQRKISRDREGNR
jgi:hypothetical protein